MDAFFGERPDNSADTGHLTGQYRRNIQSQEFFQWGQWTQPIFLSPDT